MGVTVRPQSKGQNANDCAMKICDVTQFYSNKSGGVRRYVEARRNYVNCTPHHEQVLIIPGERTDIVRTGKATVYTIRSPQIERSCGYRALLDLDSVREVVRTEAPDIIECADPYQLAWAVLAEANRSHCHAIAFYHSNFTDTYTAGLRRLLPFLTQPIRSIGRVYVNQLYNRYERTLVPSKPLANMLSAWGIQNVTPVRLGFDGEIFKPGPRDDELRNGLSVDSDQILILYVGRLAPEKNLGILVRAFRLLHSTEPGRWKLILIGEGPLKRDLVHVAGPDSGIVVLPYVSDPYELARYYRSADIFVHPGIHETFGLVTVEAQACGIPVIGIRGTFMDALALTGIQHWAEDDSPSSLAQSIQHLSRMDMREEGRAAARAAHENYCWSQVFPSIFQIYESVLAPT